MSFRSYNRPTLGGKKEAPEGASWLLRHWEVHRAPDHRVVPLTTSGQVNRPLLFASEAVGTVFGDPAIEVRPVEGLARGRAGFVRVLNEEYEFHRL